LKTLERHAPIWDNSQVLSERKQMATLTQIDPDVEDGIEYPSSDGKPMAESEIHLLVMVEVFQMLRNHFASRADAYIIANMLWYWKRGKPSACSSPDIMVIFGVDKTVRRSFKSWAEGGAVPAVAIEMASKSTWRQRLNENMEEYERLGVKEYFIFDPDSRYLPEQLMGFRLRKGRYVAVKPDDDGAMLSREMNLRLIPRGKHLRPADQNTGKLLLTDAELAAEERERADSLQAELDRLRAELGQGKPKTNGAGPKTPKD